MKSQGLAADNSIRRQLLENSELQKKLLLCVSQAGTAAQRENTDNVRSLVEFITPSTGLLHELVADPVACLSGNMHNHYYSGYLLTICNTLITQPELLERVCSSTSRPLSGRAVQTMMEKLLNFGLLRDFLRHYGMTDAEVSPLVLRLFDVVFSAVANEKCPQFYSEVKNFMQYYALVRSKQQKKHKQGKKEGKEEHEKDEQCAESEAIKRFQSVVSGSVDAFVQSVDFGDLNDLLTSSARSFTHSITSELNKGQKTALKGLMTTICASTRLGALALVDRLLLPDSPCSRASSTACSTPPS